MSVQNRGVIIYGQGADVVAEALQEIGPQYVLADIPKAEPGMVPVLCRQDATDADTARDAAAGAEWLIVELYQPGSVIEHARSPMMYLNTSTVSTTLAARAIHQADLITWYEIINPIRVTTTDGRTPAHDYSNLQITVPEGNRMIAHAVKEGGPPPECLETAQQILPSPDLWALAGLGGREICQVCIDRHA